MKRMGKVTKRIVTVCIAFAMLLGLPGANLAMLSENGLNTVQAASKVSRESVHDGAILHAFCWNFNTIKENMADIAAAGYTAVQTSPINDCLSTEPGLTLYSDSGKWYYHYQPTDWVIGNYQLGTRDEFKAMCETADEYGIAVIVDIDPNHTTPLFNQISQKFLDAVGASYDDVTNLYHINGSDVSRNIDYSDRVSVVYDPMGGLPDVDTESDAFQAYFYQFLADCIDCGADGFRIDTAKHIALPDDGVPEAYAGQEDRNDFYPNMKSYIDDLDTVDYEDLFVYGEVLQGDTDRLAAYQDMLGGTTASNYGAKIRSAVSSGSLSASKLESYGISDDTTTGTTYTADSDKLVTWVESHDNYINDKSYNTVDDTEVILGWAIIASREAGTPLFFSRPNNSSAENPWGDNVLGAAGSDLYKDPQVVAVNKFRTAMAGEDEYLRNPNGNNSVLMVERGTKGAVIINGSDETFDLESETNLADGTYINSVEGEDSIFTVQDGVISGKIAAKSVVVLDEATDGEYSTLFFFNSKQWSSVSAIVDDNTYDCDSTGDGWWKVTIPSEEFEVVFTDGTSKSDKFSITSTSGKYLTGENSTCYMTKAEAEKAIGVVTTSVYFYNTEEWSTVKAYAWLDGGAQIFGGWPGATAKNEGDYWWRADVKLMSDDDFSIIFNNGSGAQTVDIKISDKTKTYIALDGGSSNGNLTVGLYSSKDEAMDATGIYPDKTTVYFYNTKGWETVGVYTWGAVSLGDWPGQEATYDGDDWWKMTINAAPGDDFNIIFNDMGKGSQTGDLKVTSIKNVYFWGSNAYSSKKEAEAAAKAASEREAEEVEEEDGYTLVYFYDENQWDDVYVYAWGGNYNNCIGDWPGTQMTFIGDNWYAANVLTEAIEKTDLHLIFNNGNGTQLDDNVMTDKTKLYFVSRSTDAFSSKDEVMELVGKTTEEDDDDDNDVTYKDVEEETEVADGMVRVYYQLGADWDSDVFMYAWLKQADGNSGGLPLGEWPGTKMTHIGKGWHYVDIPEEYWNMRGESEELSEDEEDVEEEEPTEVDEDNEDIEEELPEESSDEEFDEEVEEDADAQEEEAVEEDADTQEDEAEDEGLTIASNNVYVVGDTGCTLKLIINDKGTHQQIDDAETLVTTNRPTDEELGKTTEATDDNKEENNTSNNESSTSTGQTSSSSSSSQASTSTSSSATSSTSTSTSSSSTSVSASTSTDETAATDATTTTDNTATADTESETPNEKTTVTKTASNATKESSKDTTSDDSNTTALTATTEEADSNTDSQSIQDAETPAAATETESGNTAVVIVLIAVMIAFAGGGAFVVSQGGLARFLTKKK